ncbi:hypothetical protein AAZX31_15G185000 [Glycine max]
MERKAMAVEFRRSALLVENRRKRDHLTSYLCIKWEKWKSLNVSKIHKTLVDLVKGALWKKNQTVEISQE